MGSPQEAGRELDALVAREVMGLGIAVISGFPCEVEYHAESPSKIRGFPKRHVPHYSTDIAAAWEVAEKMLADGFDVTVFTSAKNRRPHCEIARVEWQGSEVEEADTAPLAICRAALAAKIGSGETSGNG